MRTAITAVLVEPESTEAMIAGELIKESMQESHGDVAGNFLNPFSWFSGKNQKVLDDADAGKVDNLNTNSLGGKLLDQRMQKEEAMRKLLGR